MREIEFRGYDTDDKVWRYGHYLLKEDVMLSPMYASKAQYEADKKKNEHHFILFGGLSDWNLPIPYYSSEVDGDSVGQYAEVCDKNKKKIYEGDILRGHGNALDLSLVCYGEFYVIDAETFEPVDSVVGWYYKPIGTDAISKMEPFCLPMPLTKEYVDRCEFEVIGNAYENPELLN